MLGFIVWLFIEEKGKILTETSKIYNLVGTFESIALSFMFDFSPGGFIY